MTAEFLESNGAQYVKIPYVTTESTVSEGSAQFLEFYDTNSVKYAMGTTNYPYGLGWGVFDVNTGSWGWYFSGKKSTGFSLDSKPDKLSVIRYKINTQGELRINGNKVKDGSPQTKTDAVVTSIGLFGYIQTNGNVKTGEKQRHFYCNICEGNKKTVSLRATIDANGVPCMFDTVTKQPFYNSGSGAFIVGLTLEQARKLGKLPAGGGTLKVSLPSNYLENEGVVNAIAEANAKGWSIEVASTWEATGASATFAIRRIWVRKTQDEQGNYVAADGTRWAVESCVAMYNADGSEPDAHGYEPFRSVDAAVSYWELEPYVYPEEELLTI